MTFNYKTSSVAIMALLDLLKDEGISADQIAERTGIATHKIGRPDISISLYQMKSLWDFGIEVSQDPALGLHLRDQYGQNFMHFVISIGKNSETLLETAKHWCRYARVICESDRVELTETKGNYLLTYSNFDPGFQCASMTEHDIVQAVKYGRLFTDGAFNPVEVHFAHKRPSYADAYENTLKCPVKFERDISGIVMKKADLDKKIVSRDPHLQAILKKHAESKMRQISDSETLGSRIKLFIVKNLAAGKLDIESAALSMNMSRSTLHRKLKREGVTFSNLLENTRKTISITYLKQNMDSTQMAYLLGFADPSSFQHAFKRWYGKSPGEFKKELRAC